jgi:tetratricopeptide (TPR) repeat protein
MLVLGTLRRLTSLKTQSIPFGIPPSALYRLVPVFCLLSAIAIFLLKPIFPDRVGNLIIFHHAEHWWLWFQVVLFMAGGIQILLLACSDWWQRREASSLLLVLWTLGIFIFASFVNWSLNARSFLPMVPALGILVARRVRGTKVGEWVSARGRGTEPKAPSYPLTHLLTFAFPAFVAGVVALCVAKADYDLAGAGRAAAARFCANYARPGAVLLFEGHWGFQYYMEKLGARALDLDYHKLMPDEMVVVPEPASGTRALPEELVEWIGTRQDVSSSPCSTMNPPAEAGFYSDFFGRLPFVFGVPQTASFALYKVIHPDDHALLQSVGQEEPIARIRRCRAALEAHPNDARLHFDLADAYVGQSMSSEAVAEYREGLRLKPDSPEALNNIAWILATDADPQLRNGSEAVRLAERACELAAWKTAQYVGTLAAAYAAAGRVQDAVVAADKAISLAEKAGQQDLAQRNRELREGYMRKQ